MPTQENQKALLSSMHTDDHYIYHGLTSCQWLERRFVHAENRFVYGCNDPDDGDGCPKSGSGRRGMADKSCLTDPYECPYRLGDDNCDDGEFRDK